MFKKIFITFFLITNSAFATEAWNSAEGLGRLTRSQFKNDFYQLINFYQAQINPVYCSAATSVAILNALNYGEIPSQKISEITKPNGEAIEFKLYTQQGFFNEETNKIKSRDIIEYKASTGEKIFENSEWKEVYDAGLSLGDLTKILSKVYNLKTELTYAKKNDEKSVNKFRETLKKVLADKTSFIIVNFDGKILGTKTGGHISALAAYDEESDSVLVLDAALHKNQWYFAEVKKLYEAMNSMDGETYRGYLVVNK